MDGYVLTSDFAFQSTLPIREETRDADAAPDKVQISIHSSHTGRDGGAAGKDVGSADFNPLFPYGKRLNKIEIILERIIFQSTLPIREETRLRWIISTAALIFQSTLPIREETAW